MTHSMLRAIALLAAGPWLAATAPAEAQGREEDRFLGDIILVAFPFCPRNYAEANGATLPVADYSSLYSIYGMTYGGQPGVNFALPDLRGRVPVGQGPMPGGGLVAPGQQLGAETSVLTLAEMPEHSHRVVGTLSAPAEESPAGNRLASFPAGRPAIYARDQVNVPMAEGMVSETGSSEPFNITADTIAMRYCVRIVGPFPSRN